MNWKQIFDNGTIITQGEIITDCLKEVGNNKTRAANLLCMSRPKMDRKLKAYAALVNYSILNRKKL